MNKNFLLLFAQIIACWPVWAWYGRRLAAGNPDDQGGLIAVATAMIFLYLQRETKARIKINWVIPSLLMLAFAISFHAAPPMVRAILAVTAISYTVRKNYCGQKFHPAMWGLLLLALPVIPLLQFYLGYPLRMLVGAMTSPLLQLSGIAVGQEGTGLNWNGQIISIDAPCSGIKMLWTGLYLIFTLAIFYRLSIGKTILAVSAGMPVIIGGNALRAAALFYLETGIAKLPATISADTAHAATGVIVFLLTAIGLAWLLQWLQRWQIFTTENVCEQGLSSSSPAVLQP